MTDDDSRAALRLEAASIASALEMCQRLEGNLQDLIARIASRYVRFLRECRSSSDENIRTLLRHVPAEGTIVNLSKTEDTSARERLFVYLRAFADDDDLDDLVSEQATVLHRLRDI